MPQLLLTAHQTHLLMEIQACTGMEEPFDAVELFLQSAQRQINHDWLNRLQFLAVMNCGIVTSINTRHFTEADVPKLIGMRPREWALSMAALREKMVEDLAAVQLLTYQETVFCDYITIGSMIALMSHYDIPTGLPQDYEIASKPVLGLFLANILKLEMVAQAQKFDS